VQSAGNEKIYAEGEMIKFITLTAMLLVFFGCASVGRELDQGAVAKIQKGTPKSEVFNLLGTPDKAFYTGNGDLIWSYIYVPPTVKAATAIPAAGPSAGGANTQQQSVIITFGPDGVVKNIVSGHAGKEANTKLSPGGKAEMPNVEENKRSK